MEEIKIDHTCQIFYNTAIISQKLPKVKFDSSHPDMIDILNSERIRIEKEISFHRHRISYKASRSFPCHIHFPGPVSKIIMESSCFDKIKVWL